MFYLYVIYGLTIACFFLVCQIFYFLKNRVKPWRWFIKSKNGGKNLDPYVNFRYIGKRINQIPAAHDVRHGRKEFAVTEERRMRRDAKIAGIHAQTGEIRRQVIGTALTR